METRVALVAIIVRENASVSALNELLHQYGSYMVGRMGVPYRSRGVNIISVAMDDLCALRENRKAAGDHCQNCVRTGRRAVLKEERKRRI